jgi:hypothetical protein
MADIAVKLHEDRPDPFFAVTAITPAGEAWLRNNLYLLPEMAAGDQVEVDRSGYEKISHHAQAAGLSVKYEDRH